MLFRQQKSASQEETFNQNQEYKGRSEAKVYGLLDAVKCRIEVGKAYTDNNLATFLLEQEVLPHSITLLPRNHPQNTKTPTRNHHQHPQTSSPLLPIRGKTEAKACIQIHGL